ALDEEMQAHVLRLKQDGFNGVYSANRLTNYCGKWIKHCGWYPDTKLRLWDKRKGEWSGGLHEEVLMQPGAIVGKLKGDLHHYSYYSIKQHIDQVNKFTDIGSQQAFEKGKKSSVFTILTKSIWKFIRDYIVKLGFLDGYYGFVISAISAHATFLKYVKLKELHKNSRHE
ncbi:MAG: glycosyltransferase family 2 protein, partial [Bacteroidales bacterium]|nr:glycosyltransferase family 2 protein [Bacteroidales bacterium]